MKVDVIEVGSFQRKLQFVVPAETVRSELDQAYRLLGQRARLKGFRPGKAPKSVLEAQFGERVQSDVANQLVQGAWRDAMSAHNLKPVSRPALEASEPVRAGRAFAFTITVEVRPELKLASYTGVEVAYPRVDVTDDEVAAAVRQRLEGSARLVDVTDRPVQAGDLVMAELTAKDGKELVAQELGTMLRTDADPYYPGVEGLLLGLSIGGKAKGEVTFAETARTESIRGRTLKVAIEVKGIQANQVPELSDALAQELGFDGGADGMRAALRMQIQERREELARNQARANLLEALIAANPFAVPGAMVDESLQMLMEELKLQQAWRTGRDPKTITFSEAQVRDLRARAEFAAKASLILEFVSKTEALAVTEAELEAKYQELADTRGQSLEAVKGYFLRDGAVDELKDRMLEEKTLDWLLERATLTTPDAPAAVPAGALADVAASLVDKAVSEKKKVSEAKKKRGEEAAPEAPAAEAAPAEEKPKKKAAPKKKDEADAAPAVEAAADEKPKKKAAKKKADEG